MAVKTSVSVMVLGPEFGTAVLVPAFLSTWHLPVYLLSLSKVHSFLSSHCSGDFSVHLLSKKSGGKPTEIFFFVRVHLF